MMKNFLFPRSCRKFGWFLLIPAFITVILVWLFNFDLSKMLHVSMLAFYSDTIPEGSRFFGIVENGIVDEILLTMLIIGGLLAGFSKLKEENELTQKLRFESLVWAVYVNFGVMLFSIWFFYGFVFINVMILNIFSILLLFLCRFEIMRYRANKSAIS